MSGKIKIAIATGDPAGIGPEISLKAALDPAVRAVCDPILVGDPGIIERHAKACGIKADIRTVQRIGDADWSGARVNVFNCPAAEADKIELGAVSAAAGRASIAFARAAIKAALAGEVDAVVGAPQNETSIALAGITFDGHPSFVARQTGTDENDVYMMLCFGEQRIVHATLHLSVREAIASITREKIARVIRATDAALAPARHRRAEDLRERAQSACRRRRVVRARGNRDHQAGDRCGRGRRDFGRRPVRRRHHVSSRKASMPSS